MFPHKWPKSAFVAGDPLLDFLNTVDAQGRTAEQNRLTSYSSALAWSVAAGVLHEAEAQAVVDTASNSQKALEMALVELVEWRETAYRVLRAIANNEEPPSSDWKTVEASIQEAISGALLSRDVTGLTTWITPPDISDLKTLFQQLALGLHTLLTSHLVASIKQCEGCTWLFVDMSKNHRRRWCSMATCGNRAKVQRHYQSKTSE